MIMLFAGGEIHAVFGRKLQNDPRFFLAHFLNKLYYYALFVSKVSFRCAVCAKIRKSMLLRSEVCGVGFLYSSAPDSKVLMLVSGATPDLKNLINSYFSYTPVMFF